LLESTRAIVKRIMNARVPVIVYVAPSGSRAGSAGVFITLAAHVAVMAPTTNIGAAHPVMAGGGGGPVKKLIKRIKRLTEDGDTKRKARDVEEEIIEEEEQDPMAQKVLNDTVAWITTIAKARHRNEEWAAKAVTDSFSISETEALKERVVDLIAPDLPGLLAQVHGRTVELSGRPVELVTADARPVELPMSRRQQFLAVLTNPNIAYLLMMLGTLGLIFEFTHPGIGFPGIAGLICLLLALYAFQVLPVSYTGIALIAVGLGLLVAETMIISHGFLAVGGVLALTLGSLLLFESPEGFGVSMRVVVPVVAGLSAIVLGLLGIAVRAQRRPVHSGTAGLIGSAATAQTDLAPTGQVFLQGELWNALAESPVRKGERVRVIGIDGLTLRVTRSSA
jgi:membrane-bound serine protease (ClpP class)